MLPKEYLLENTPRKGKENCAALCFNSTAEVWLLANTFSHGAN